MSLDKQQEKEDRLCPEQRQEQLEISNTSVRDMSTSTDDLSGTTIPESKTQQQDSQNLNKNKRLRNKRIIRLLSRDKNYVSIPLDAARQSDFLIAFVNSYNPYCSPPMIYTPKFGTSTLNTLAKYCIAHRDREAPLFDYKNKRSSATTDQSKSVTEADNNLSTEDYDIIKEAHEDGNFSELYNAAKYFTIDYLLDDCQKFLNINANKEGINETFDISEATIDSFKEETDNEEDKHIPSRL